MLDRKLVAAEMNNIFNLIRASIDPSYLFELVNRKFADGKSNWNQGIKELIKKDNDENEGTAKIEVPEGYDFYGFVYKKLRRGGLNESESDIKASEVLHRIFFPRAVYHEKPKMNPPEKYIPYPEDDSSSLLPYYRNKREVAGKEYKFIVAFQDFVKKKMGTLWKEEEERDEPLDETKKEKDEDGGDLDFKKMKHDKEKEDKKDRKEVHPETGVHIEDAIGPDSSLRLIRTEKLFNEFYEFFAKEEKLKLISPIVSKIISTYKSEPKIEPAKLMEKLRLVHDDKKDQAIWEKAVEELKYLAARFAHKSKNKKLITLLKYKGRLPEDANEHYNPNQNEFTRQDVDKIISFLNSNTDKSWDFISKKFKEMYNPTLFGDLKKLHDKIDDVEEMFDFIKKNRDEIIEEDSNPYEYYKKTQKKEDPKKSSVSAISSIVSYLEELANRIR